MMKSRRLQWAEVVAQTRMCRIWMKKCLKEWPLGWLRRRWESNINMNLNDVDCEGGMWVKTDLACVQ
jgi:hypothetical protein